MQNWINVKKSEVAAIVENSFPEYRGRKIRVAASATVTLSGLNWDGGSRSQYRVVTVEGERVGSADRFNHAAPWDHAAEGKSVQIPQGVVVVQHSIFLGKCSGLRLYVNPLDMPRLLMSPVMEA